MSEGRGRYGAASVTTSATKVLSGRTSRAKAVLQPLTGDIYVGFDSSVTSSTGVLVPAGGSWDDAAPGCWSGEVWAVASSGTVSVRYQEVG